MEHHANIVPWQMLCAARARASRRPDRRRRRPDPGRARAPPAARTKLIAVTHVSNALGTMNPVKEIVGDAPGRASRCWSTAPRRPAPRRRRRGSRLRLLRLLGPQALRPDRHRRALRQGVVALDAMPPYQGGGDMIASRLVRGDDLHRAPLRSSRRGRPTSRRSSASAPRSTISTEIGLKHDRRPRADLLAYATGAPLGDPRPPHRRHREARRRASSRSSSKASTPTTSERSSTARASRSAPATTAPSP